MTRPLAAFALSALLGTVAAPRLAYAEDKLAFVDMQRALEETTDGQQAKDRLKSDFETKQKELNTKQDELKKMKEALDKKAALMKPEALQKEQQDFQQRFVQLQDTFQRLQRDLQTKEQEATRPILGKIASLVQKIAERDHLVVIERSVVIYGQPSLDLTNEVVRMYNAHGGGKGSGSGAKSGGSAKK